MRNRQTEAEIFDLDDLSDLPKSVRERVFRAIYGANTGNVLSLFKIKHTLTIDEIIVGLYRTASTEKSRAWVNSCVYNLTKRGLLKRVSSGVYSLAKD